VEAKEREVAFESIDDIAARFLDFLLGNAWLDGCCSRE
jgi:hypothetical protein